MTEIQDYVRNIMQGRADDLEILFDIVDGDDPPIAGDYAGYTEDEAQDALDNLALSIEPKFSVDITFGIGGPADWMIAELSDDRRSIIELRFHAQWGSERFDRTVPEGSALWRYAEQVIEGMDFS